MPHTIRIATLGVPDDYRQSLIPLVIQSLGYSIRWTHEQHADLLIVGPFFRSKEPNRWIPRPLRPLLQRLYTALKRANRPLVLFQTGENLRHDHVECDYSLSFDLAIDGSRHARFPYWYEMVDWSNEGINGNTNPRFGQLLQLSRLATPLGNEFLKKPRQAALFASHLREPRKTLLKALAKQMQVTGFGSIFDSSIKHHSSSNFRKIDVLRNFGFNLCPENSMYPGYYTEKIPEAFMANALPITWTDTNVHVDFNPEAFINLAGLTGENFAELPELLSHSRLNCYAEQPLLSQIPSLTPVRTLMTRLLNDATT